jgi:farnesyl diphosphate synthase
MEIKKTGKLFSFCCMAPAIIKNKSLKEINYFEKIGSNIGLLFQITDDLIDYQGSAKMAGKKTKKDEKKGKATLISLLGYKNAIKYSDKIKSKIINNLKKYEVSSKNISETLNYILTRNK